MLRREQVMAMAQTDYWREASAGRDVRDAYGRRYLLGPADRVLLGHSRAWVAAAAWAAMLAVSGTQYAYGVVAARLWHPGPGTAVPGTAMAGVSPASIAWAFALWIGCQSAGSAALPWLRRRAGLSPARAVLLGAAGCAAGLLGLGIIGLGGPGRGVPGNLAAGLAVFGIAAGLGAGLVYGACVAVTAAWYPERPVITAVVSGAFGYGAIPVVLIGARTGNLAVSCDVLAWVMLAIAAPCAPLLREPPARWWPAHLDPRQWAVDKALNRALRHDPPLAREHSASEVARTRTALGMGAVAVAVWAVALLDTGCLVSFFLGNGLGLTDGAIALAAFAAGSGAIRPLAVGAAGYLGWRRVAAAAIAAGVAAQLALAAGGVHHAVALLWVAACCAGAAAGTWYALLPGIVARNFGDRPGLPNLWVLYSVKAQGGLIAACCAAWLVPAAGYPVTMAASGVAGLGGLVLLPQLRRPGTLPGRPTRAARAAGAAVPKRVAGP
jgi:MFS family permease